MAAARLAAACCWAALASAGHAAPLLGSGKPLPVGPPPRLPSLDASGYPPYRPVFVRGECDANDIDYSQPTARINTNKTCFTCFRIPTLVRIPGTGTILVFAEARRTQLDVVAFHGMTAPAGDSCPDAPDTRIVYKRSVDGGNAWSGLRVLAEGLSGLPYPRGAGPRAENGKCYSQPAPISDPTTNVTFVAFNLQTNRAGQCDSASTVPHIMNSTDDGLSASSNGCPSHLADATVAANSLLCRDPDPADRRGRRPERRAYRPDEGSGGADARRQGAADAARGGLRWQGVRQLQRRLHLLGQPRRQLEL